MSGSGSFFTRLTKQWIQQETQLAFVLITSICYQTANNGLRTLSFWVFVPAFYDWVMHRLTQKYRRYLLKHYRLKMYIKKQSRKSHTDLMSSGTEHMKTFRPKRYDEEKVYFKANIATCMPLNEIVSFLVIIRLQFPRYFICVFI